MYKWMLLVVFLAGCQSHPVKQFHGKWETGPYNDGSFAGIDGKLRYAATPTNMNGVYFHLVNNCAARLLFTDKLATETAASVTTQVDLLPKREYLAGSSSEDRYKTVLTFYVTPDEIAEYRAGQTMQIQVEGDIFRVNLVGANKALAPFKCD